MTRGDTLVAEVGIVNPDGTPYVMQEGDSVRFKCTDVPGGAVLILKDVTSGTLRIEHEDTASLPFGTYFFDIEMAFANGTVDTFITEGTLTVDYEADAITLGVAAPVDGGE
jgi:hypothetical protein